MADIAITAALKIGTAALNIIGNLAVDERNRLHGLSGDIDWIQGKMRWIRDYLKNADSKPVRSQETALIENISDLGYDMEDISETFLPPDGIIQQSCCWDFYFRRSISIFCYWSTARDFAMEIAKIRTTIEDIDGLITSYEITAGGAEREINWVRRPPSFNGNESDIIGSNRVIEGLKTKLVDESEIKRNFISIVGMPGLGKTTLAKELFSLTMDQFQCSASVYVSQRPNVTEIIKDIARQVGLEEEKRKDNLKANLWEYLKEKRYVIMLDDIWDKETWNALERSISPINSKNGSRIILTSRNTGVGRFIGGESSLFELQPSDRETSWQLFCKMVMAPDPPYLPSELEDIGWEIVKRCGGGPLAM